MTRFARGGMILRGTRDSDAVPAFLSPGDQLIPPGRLPERQLEQFAEALGAVADRQPRLRTPLPRRVRARLAVTRAADGAAIWLVDRKRFRAAERLWHASGMLGEKSSR